MGLTFNQYFRDQLSGSGLFPDMIDTVMPLIVNDESLRGTMSGRWNSQVDGYPPIVVQLAYRTASPIIFKWISENHPRAWFRPIFAPGIDTCDDPDAFVNRFWEEHMPKTPEPEQESVTIVIGQFVRGNKRESGMRKKRRRHYQSVVQTNFPTGSGSILSLKHLDKSKFIVKRG